jgi:hypothetical protein
LFLLMLASCKTEQATVVKNQRIAFIADAHFADIFGKFEDNDYQGIKNPVTGAYANIRTMSSQLHSTRIFNENYFAFLEALNDIARRGIKLVALPGDFSDDGQPIHVRGLKRILNDYTKKYGISFFLTTGNHDVVKPFSQDDAKTDFLGEGGKNQIITSSRVEFNIGEDELEPIVTLDIKNLGYKEMAQEVAAFGFFPSKNYLYWETPFSNYSYNKYTFDEALTESSLDKRIYPVKNTSLYLPDLSYLVEPVKGVWLLAIDANAYVPVENLSGDLNNPEDFSGASIGYNNTILYKKHLINWVKKVSEEAEKNGKILIAFSHYPMVDFNDDATPELKQFFGENKMQLQRVPVEAVAQSFADAGLQIHFGGHMHINDTGVRTTAKGNTLFNIQTPSLAAYTPAYKILTISSASNLEVETVVVDSVQKFNSLFSFYEQEFAYLEKYKGNKIWNKDILKAETYIDFTEWHLKELIRLRFLPEDFPVDFLESFLKLSGKELFEINKNKLETNQILLANNLTIQDFKSWTGYNMIFDFYKLRSADELARAEIGYSKLKQYELVCEQLRKGNNEQLILWAKIFQKKLNGKPSNHFTINLKSKIIKRVNY